VFSLRQIWVVGLGVGGTFARERMRIDSRKAGTSRGEVSSARHLLTMTMLQRREGASHDWGPLFSRHSDGNGEGWGGGILFRRNLRGFG
jgi:hypothetical protein